jgi:hypothetical protein
MRALVLAEILAEWHAYDGNPYTGSSSSSNLDTEKYEHELARLHAEIKAGRLPKDAMADAIWEKAVELATCTNGGWKAWCCPFGCAPHMASFSTWKEQMDQAKKRKAEQRRLNFSQRRLNRDTDYYVLPL